MPWHAVSQGECLSTIAEHYGVEWEDTWEHPNNAELRETRDDPNVLLPGDIVYVPQRTVRRERGATEQRHRFQRATGAAWLRLRLLDGMERPFANRRWELSLEGGQTVSGTTNGDGELEHEVSRRLDRGTLTLLPDTPSEAPLRWELSIGHLDPVASMTGIQARLNNLGFHSGTVDGIIGPITRGAVRRFQEREGLVVDGIPGPITQGKLREVHGC